MKNIPVLFVGGLTLAEAYEKALVALYDSGCRFKTQYDKPDDPESIDATMNITVIEINNPPVMENIPETDVVLLNNFYKQINVTDVEDVVMGCALPEAEHGADIARLSVLDAGWDVRIPGITMQRFCGSGPSAISFASYGIKCGQFDCLVAGGVEVQSHYTVPGGGLPPGGRPFTMDGNNPHLQKLYPGLSSHF